MVTIEGKEYHQSDVEVINYIISLQEKCTHDNISTDKLGTDSCDKCCKVW